MKRSAAAGVAAVVAAMVLGGVIAGRLGAPPEFIGALALLLAVGAFAASGLAERTMRPSVYYAAGRSLGLIGGAAPILVLILAVAGLTSRDTALVDPARLAIGCAGALIYGFLVAAPLRQAGGLSFADAVEGRFGSRIVALFGAMAAFLICGGLALLLGQAVVPAFVQVSGVSAGQAAAIVAALPAMALFTGGAAGVFSAAAAIVVLLVLGWGGLLAPLSLAPSAERQRLLATAADAFAGADLSLADAGLALAFAGALAALAPSVASRDAGGGRMGAALAALLALALAFAATLALTAAEQRTGGLSGLPAKDLPAAIYSDQFKGLITICGVEPSTPDDVQRLCARAGQTGPLTRDALRIADPRSGRWLAAIMGLPAAIGAAFALAGPFALVAAFAWACHAAASVLTHDILRRSLLLRSTTSGALALQRLVALAIIAVAVFAPQPLAAFEGKATRLALFIAASAPLTLIVLGCWRRADWRAALCGLASAALAGVGVWFGYLEGPLLFLAGAAAGLIAGALAAAAFPARTDRDAAAAKVLTGHEPGPLVVDQGA